MKPRRSFWIFIIAVTVLILSFVGLITLLPTTPIVQIISPINNSTVTSPVRVAIKHTEKPGDYVTLDIKDQRGEFVTIDSQGNQPSASLTQRSGTVIIEVKLSPGKYQMAAQIGTSLTAFLSETISFTVR